MITSLGHNLIGNTVGASGFAATDLLNVDPQLEPLADNGGLTATRALRSNSPAIDAALTSSSPTIDQRGVARPQGPAADIGAYEVPANQAPIASDDGFTTDEDAPLAIAAPGVLANDADPDGDALLAALVHGPSHGTVELAADGSFVYVPGEQFFGLDSFTYQVSDGNLASSPVTVTIDVSSVNDAPTLGDASFSILENSPVGTTVGTLLAADIEGDAISYAIVLGNEDGALAIDPESGEITVANAGLLDYETRPVLSLSVRATDAHGDWDEALVTILLEDVAEVIPLWIDIRPGDADNDISRKSHGKLDVVIYSTATFSAEDIDIQSLTFGRTGDENSLSRGPHGPRYRYADLNGDGRLDLVVTFETELTGFQAGDTRGFLRGRTRSGQEVGGSDAVRIR
jgi:VCBS repeat-containing protein